MPADTLANRINAMARIHRCGTRYSRNFYVEAVNKTFARVSVSNKDVRLYDNIKVDFTNG